MVECYTSGILITVPLLKVSEKLKDAIHLNALRFIVELDEKLGEETPEEDYGKIATLKSLVTYIMEKKK